MRKVALMLLVATVVILALLPGVAVAVPEACGNPERSGICGGKVEVRNMYLGARAESSVWIYNGKDYEATYDLYYKHPDAVEVGFSQPPIEAKEWVAVGDEQPGDIETVAVPAREWVNVPIALELPEEKPKGVKIPSKWEFRIRIMERQTGMIVEAYEQRWIIEMAPPGFSLGLVIGSATGALAIGGAIGAYVMRKRSHR